MSTRKRPLGESSAPPQRTPSRSAPSTPHTRRALEQRSAAKQRSVQGRRSLHAGAQPLSIGGILRRLARATATKSQRTPIEREEDKENEEREGSEEEDDMYMSPRLMRDLDGDGDEEDLVPPTPSVLPGDDDEEREDGADPTLTFKAIDFARGEVDNGGPATSTKGRRSGARVSFAPTEGDGEEEYEDDGDDTMLTAEMGRRALSEGPLDRYHRNSFGSIRMSDFAMEEQRRQSGKTADISGFVDDFMLGMGDDEVDMDLTQGGETMDLRRLRREEDEDEVEHDLFVSPNGGNDNDGTFLLQMPEAAGQDLPRSTISPSLKRPLEQPDDPRDEDFEDFHSGSDEDAGPINTLGERSPTNTRNQTPLEAVASRPRKKLKLTRHGTTIPSLPISLIKRIAIDARTRVGKKKPVLGKDHIKALEQATEWFFEQVGEDLEAYSNHARRKKRVIGEDVLTLMRRQRLCKKPGELGKLSKEWLPRKVLEELDVPGEL